MKKDLYDILGVNKKANKKDIKAAYRDKAKINHPDQGGDATLFTEINKAYTILINDEKRRYYDETGRINENPQDKIDQAAYDRLGKYFLDIIANKKDRIFEADIIGIMKTNIFGYIIQCKQIIEEAKQEEKYLKKVKKKIKYKGKNVNLFIVIIEDKIKNCKFIIYQAKIDIKVFNKMKIILKDFEFDFDKAKSGCTIFNRTTTSNYVRIDTHGI